MDDFKLIKEIGPAIERRLHEAGITTFVQLATLSPDDVATLVNGAGVSSSRIVKENWIGRAEELATATEGEATGKGRRREEESGGEVATVAPPLEATSADPADDLQLELDDASFEEVQPSMARAGLARAGYGRGSAFEYLERAPPRSPRPQLLRPRPRRDRRARRDGRAGSQARAASPRRVGIPGGARVHAAGGRRYQLLGTVVISDYNTVGVAVGPKLKVIPEASAQPAAARSLHEHEIDEGVGPSSRFSTTRMMFPSAAVYRFDLTVLSSSPMR